MPTPVTTPPARGTALLGGWGSSPPTSAPGRRPEYIRPPDHPDPPLEGVRQCDGPSLSPSRRPSWAPPAGPHAPPPSPNPPGPPQPPASTPARPPPPPATAACWQRSWPD